ncbi:MAG TPA: hypothetical protein VNV35_04310 [Puia sp.]|jgi:hypothetical protein|nr:hypothetical protein [Puia sp.]
MLSAATPDRQYRSSWFMKFVESFFAAIAILNTLALMLEILPPEAQRKLGQKFFAYTLLGQALISLLFAVVYSIYWQRKEIKNRINSGKLHAWMRGILRYWLVLVICTYGFAKVLKTQFGTTYTVDDMPVGRLNGFELTWNYFGHSYAFALIIAFCQIGGSILLLFRRTTLLGAAILLPVMINIVLINFFYDISPGAFMNSVLFSLGLLFLLLLSWSALVAVFLPTGSELPEPRLGFFRFLFRFLAVACAFGLIYYFTTLKPPTPLAGKWTVDRLIRNGDTIKANTWLADSTAWTTVYIEDYGYLGLCPNPYVYDDDRSTWAGYKYDSSKQQMRLIFSHEKPDRRDTVIASVSHFDGRHMQWKGVIGKDTLLFLLSKVEKKK